MFVNKPKMELPKGAKESYAVRYQGGRKVFDDFTSAAKFAQEQKGLPKGWAEVIQVVEIVVRPR